MDLDEGKRTIFWDPAAAATTFRGFEASKNASLKNAAARNDAATSSSTSGVARTNIAMEETSQTSFSSPAPLRPTDAASADADTAAVEGFPNAADELLRPEAVVDLRYFATAAAASTTFLGFGAPNPNPMMTAPSYSSSSSCCSSSSISSSILLGLYPRLSALRTFLFLRSVAKLRNFLPDDH